jgi:hypothetical protein
VYARDGAAAEQAVHDLEGGVVVGDVASADRPIVLERHSTEG